MTYDYSGSWENVANHLAPLYMNPNDPSYPERKENSMWMDGKGILKTWCSRGENKCGSTVLRSRMAGS